MKIIDFNDFMRPTFEPSGFIKCEEEDIFWKNAKIHVPLGPGSTPRWFAINKVFSPTWCHTIMFRYFTNDKRFKRNKKRKLE
jgi:hypothetical protein